MAPETPLTSAAAVRLLDGGERPTEQELVRLLRSPGCPASLVERLAGCRWVLRERRVLPLVVRHPACPRSFALEGAGRLGWRDLLDIARHPRASPFVRRHAERRLLDRLPQMTRGERIALARLATRSVIAGLLGCDDVACVAALLDNPQFVEGDAVRLLGTNDCAGCVLAVLHHPRWGGMPPVVRAALRHQQLPTGIALGLLATLGAGELADLVAAPRVPEPVRAAAQQLLRHRDPAE